MLPLHIGWHLLWEWLKAERLSFRSWRSFFINFHYHWFFKTPPRHRTGGVQGSGASVMVIFASSANASEEDWEASNVARSLCFCFSRGSTGHFCCVSRSESLSEMGLAAVSTSLLFTRIPESVVNLFLLDGLKRLDWVMKMVDSIAPRRVCSETGFLRCRNSIVHPKLTIPVVQTLSSLKQASWANTVRSAVLAREQAGTRLERGAWPSIDIQHPCHF